MEVESSSKRKEWHAWLLVKRLLSSSLVGEETPARRKGALAGGKLALKLFYKDERRKKKSAHSPKSCLVEEIEI